MLKVKKTAMGVELFAPNGMRVVVEADPEYGRVYINKPPQGTGDAYVFNLNKDGNLIVNGLNIDRAIESYAHKEPVTSKEFDPTDAATLSRLIKSAIYKETPATYESYWEFGIGPEADPTGGYSIEVFYEGELKYAIWYDRAQRRYGIVWTGSHNPPETTEYFESLEEMAKMIREDSFVSQV
jgi:hypothetical protein